MKSDIIQNCFFFYLNWQWYLSVSDQDHPSTNSAVLPAVMDLQIPSK